MAAHPLLFLLGLRPRRDGKDGRRLYFDFDHTLASFFKGLCPL